MKANTLRNTRPRWSLKSSFYTVLGILILATPLVLLTVKKSIWVELEMITGITLGEQHRSAYVKNAMPSIVRACPMGGCFRCEFEIGHFAGSGRVNSFLKWPIGTTACHC